VCVCVVAEIFRINHICQRKNINKIYGTQCVLVRLCASACINLSVWIFTLAA